MRAFHKWAAIGWALGGGVVCLWVSGSAFEFWMLFLSFYAVVGTHWAAYQGGRAEEAAKEGR